MIDSNGYKKHRKVLSVIKLILFIVIVFVVPIFIFVTRRDLIDELNNLDNLVRLADSIRSNQMESALIYIGLQILQIVISVLPGQIFQMAAGYLFGLPLGLLYSVIGAILGSAIAYYIAYFLGRDALKLFLKPETIEHWVELLNSKKAYIIVFLLYLIPGLPKDVIAYPAGISNMKVRAFLFLSILGRLPAMTASVLMGYLYESEKYYWVGGIAIFSIVIFLICFIKRQAISSYLDKIYQKISA